MQIKSYNSIEISKSKIGRKYEIISNSTLYGFNKHKKSQLCLVSEMKIYHFSLKCNNLCLQPFY